MTQIQKDEQEILVVIHELEKKIEKHNKEWKQTFGEPPFWYYRPCGSKITKDSRDSDYKRFLDKVSGKVA